nr:hypothetical protein BaRGS_011051 [Batillaria attramentaria]
MVFRTQFSSSDHNTVSFTDKSSVMRIKRFGHRALLLLTALSFGSIWAFGSEKRGWHSDQSGVVRFRARPPWHKTPGIVEHEVHDEVLMRNDTIISGGPLEVPRVAEYCNIPTEVQLGEEGEVPPGYTLVSAYALIRHGDRTPMNTLLDVPRPQPREGCIMNRASLKKYPEFRRFMYDMAIAKDKQAPGSYFAKWALYPQHKDCGNSQLTGRGALQHLHNGLALKEKYVKKWNLFGDKFSPATQLKLRSTQYSRTYQSAVSFLYAFLPHFDITQLDIQASADTVFCHAKYVPQACCNALIKLKQAVDRPPNNRGRKSPHYIPAFGPLAETTTEINHY